MVYNPYLIVPAATWAVAQVSKFAWAALKGQVDFRLLYSSGRMPSVHSALVMSLATTALLIDGAGSAAFGLAIILAFIVMYDSLGVRRAAGEQAKALNAILDGLERSKVRLDPVPARVHEILGHRPSEVVVGAVMGVVLGGLFNYSHLGAVGTFLQTVPSLTETIVYASIGVVLIIGSLVVHILLGRRKSPALRQVSRQVLTFGQTIGWLSILAAVLIYEHASYLAWRLWAVIILTVGVVWLGSLIVRWRKRLPQALDAERVAARKRRWLTFGRRKRKA